MRRTAVIEAAFAQPGWQGWVFGLAATLAAGLTAFYMTRLMLMTFFGEKRWERLQSADGHDYHPHESPATMTWVGSSCWMNQSQVRTASSSPAGQGCSGAKR